MQPAKMSIAGKSEQSIKNEIAVVKAFKKARFGSVKPIKAYTEVESGKRTTNRPKLAEAIQSCRAYKAKLVIAKLDRLSRDAHFLLGLEKAGIDFVATDM
jgi:DNA invertase Pin-like site-specific DNA recombinase